MPSEVALYQNRGTVSFYLVNHMPASKRDKSLLPGISSITFEHFGSRF